MARKTDGEKIDELEKLVADAAVLGDHLCAEAEDRRDGGDHDSEAGDVRQAVWSNVC